MPEGEYVDVKIKSIEQTSRTHGGLTVLKISLMVQVSMEKYTEFRAEVYSDRVELLDDPGESEINLHPDELKDLFAEAAHKWEKEFGDYDADILSRDQPLPQ